MSNSSASLPVYLRSHKGLSFRRDMPCHRILPQMMWKQIDASNTTVSDHFFPESWNFAISFWYKNFHLFCILSSSKQFSRKLSLLLVVIQNILTAPLLSTACSEIGLRLCIRTLIVNEYGCHRKFNCKFHWNRRYFAGKLPNSSSFIALRDPFHVGAGNAWNNWQYTSVYSFFHSCKEEKESRLLFTNILVNSSNYQFVKNESKKTRRKQLAKNNCSKIQGRKLVEKQLARNTTSENSSQTIVNFSVKYSANFVMKLHYKH